MIYEQFHYPGWSFGAAATLLEVPPGDHFPWLVASEPDWGLYARTAFTQGRVHAIRGGPDGVSIFANPCGCNGYAPKIGLREMRLPRVLPLTRKLHPTIRVTVHDAPAGAPVALMLGQSTTTYQGVRLPLALGALGLPACFLRVSGDVVLAARTGTTGLDRGYAAVELPIVLDVAGRHRLYGQWVCLDPTARRVEAVSDALSWRAR